MEATNNEQRNIALIRLPERLASATVNPRSPSDLVISCEGSAASGPEGGVVSTIALARINRLPLLHWLIAAINGTLGGEAPGQQRPEGILIECGRFVAAGSEVWAHDWYGHGRRCLVARCADVAGAEVVASTLSRLLRP